MLAESTAGRIASEERYCHFVTADGLYVFTDGIEPLLEPSAFGQTSLRASHENESGLFSGDHLAVTKWANLAPGHDRRCVSVTLPIHDRVGETSSSSRSNRDEKSALLECADLLHMLLRHTAPVVEPAESDLAAAVRDLGEVITEATESGFRVPSRMALSNAEQLLHAMHKGHSKTLRGVSHSRWRRCNRRSEWSRQLSSHAVRLCRRCDLSSELARSPSKQDLLQHG